MSRSRHSPLFGIHRCMTTLNRNLASKSRVDVLESIMVKPIYWSMSLSSQQGSCDWSSGTAHLRASPAPRSICIRVARFDWLLSQIRRASGLWQDWFLYSSDMMDCVFVETFEWNIQESECPYILCQRTHVPKWGFLASGGDGEFVLECHKFLLMSPYIWRFFYGISTRRMSESR